MRLKLDFAAQDGTHFGDVKILDEMLAAIPNPVDYWDATAASVTTTGGRVSAWTGKLGRQFVQTTAARRPVFTGNGLRMANSDGNTAEAIFTLAGAQIGEQTALTIATRVRIAAPALDVDGQYLWAGSSPILRVMYRDSGNNYIRSQILSSANSNIDVDIPEAQADIGVIMVANGTSFSMHVAGFGTGSFEAAANASFSNLFLGSATGVTPTLVGWQKRFGVWRHVPTADELATLLKWVA
ncbi:hypothetical protein [Paracoccus simplex]|uniref:Uncharacterized protein n=1 Tax=Paracoccus simplex TaxID=2086346 RepID=A0ABV7RW28_9RHOB